MSEAESLLSPRERIILRAVISHYILTGEAVSSRTISRFSDCPWSPATIRNVMSDLAEAGFLQQPHRSSGRMPSDKGFRFYVEQLLLGGLKPLSPSTFPPFFQGEAEVDKLLVSTPRLLSSMTHQIGVLLAPHFAHIHLRSIDFIPLGGSKILAVLVARSGNIINKVLEGQEPYGREELIRFSNYLTTEFKGLTLLQVKEKLEKLRPADRRGDRHPLDGALTLSRRLVSMVSRREETIHVEGLPEDHVAQRILQGLGHSDLEKDRLVELLSSCVEAEGTRIFIGSEAPFTEENGCSIVATSYDLGEGGHGAIGVIGKKSMAYDKIIPVVEETARHLNLRLSTPKEVHDDR